MVSPPKSSEGRKELRGEGEGRERESRGLEEIKTGSGISKRVLGVKTAGPCTYLEFPGNAWQPGLGAAEAAASLSESRKAFEARAEDWGRRERGTEMLRSQPPPSHLLHAKSEYLQGRDQGARCGETDNTHY